MLQTLNFNGPRQINAQATFFRYESGSAGGADESIRVRADGSDLGLFWPGDAVELNDPAKLWEIVPATPSCVGVVRVGMGRVQSARLVGTVQVIDGERQKVTSGQCFRAYATQTGNKAAVQVWNPANSGKNIYVQAVRAGASTADSWQVQTSTNALGGAGPTPANLDRSGGASVSLIRTGDASTLSGIADMAAGYMQASNDVVLVFPRPVLLRPGLGLAFLATAAANSLRACFEWEEWPV